MNPPNKPFAERTQEKMKEVLMKPDAPGPAVHYYMIRGGADKKNITIWETGTVGGEYIKAYGHYHVDDLKETYWILEGQGIVLMQMRKKKPAGGTGQSAAGNGRNDKWLDDELEWVKAVFVKPGDVVAIPPFAGHLMINIGPTWLVTSDDSPFQTGAAESGAASADSASMPQHADYEAVKKMRGFAYYVCENPDKNSGDKNPAGKNAQPLFVKNPLYKDVPGIEIVKNIKTGKN
jgi:oxalate decarboxylase/phosphoglucose isomerase-like protein (cupin superfamily)